MIKNILQTSLQNILYYWPNKVNFINTILFYVIRPIRFVRVIFCQLTLVTN